jgi:fatty-acyl-CoA synthase
MYFTSHDISIFAGGERLSHDLIKFVNDAFKSVLIYYGLTEAYHCYKNQPTSQEGIYTTQMMPHTEIKVVDDVGKVVPRGTPGHFHVRSPITMIGFLDDPESTNRILYPSGWLNTEDIAVIDESGFVDIVGRTKDIISCGGRKIYPKTIEKVLVNCPKVENVIVIGVPDVRLSQVVCACVLPISGEKVTEKELKDFYSDSILGTVAVTPKYFWLVDDIPRGSTGKFDRQKLAEMAARHFNLN